MLSDRSIYETYILLYSLLEFHDDIVYRYKRALLFYVLFIPLNAMNKIGPFSMFQIYYLSYLF